MHATGTRRAISRSEWLTTEFRFSRFICPNFMSTR